MILKTVPKNAGTYAPAPCICRYCVAAGAAPSGSESTLDSVTASSNDDSELVTSADESEYAERPAGNAGKVRTGVGCLLMGAVLVGRIRGMG